MFALADINSFYASCEKVFRPDLRNEPVIVLSNNDGCVIARSLVSGETDAPGEENTCIFQQLCAVPQHEPTGYGCSGVAFSRS